jgi:SSS family solute:Na+ symporter
VAGLTTGLLLGLFVLGSLRRPVASDAALAGLLMGAMVVLCAWLPSTWGSPVVAWPWYAPIGTGVTVAVALTAHRLRRHNGSPDDGGAKPGLD